MANRSRPSGARMRPRPPILEAESGLQLALEPFGPGPERIRQVEEELHEHPAIREELGRARWRLLTTELLEEEALDKRKIPLPSDRFFATQPRVILVP